MGTARSRPSSSSEEQSFSRDEAPAAAPAEKAPQFVSLPRLTDESGDVEASSALLDALSMAAIAARIPHEQRARWRLLFSSADDGQSFTRFLKGVIAKGPNLVVVRDTSGNIFGGYAPESWILGPKFRGGFGCFVFTIAPKLVIHGASGDNRHFMYINMGCEELPNGCAFGGQLGHFALWLHAGLDTGEGSAVCSSFEDGLFPQYTRFSIGRVEVWATRDPDPPPDGSAGEELPAGEMGGTILQRRRQDVDFMGLAGRTMASDTL